MFGSFLQIQLYARDTYGQAVTLRRAQWNIVRNRGFMRLLVSVNAGPIFFKSGLLTGGGVNSTTPNYAQA